MHSNAGAIAGGVIGGFVLVCLLALAILIFKRKRRRHIPASAEFMNQMTPSEMPILLSTPRSDAFREADVTAGYTDAYYNDPVLEKIELSRRQHVALG